MKPDVIEEKSKNLSPGYRERQALQIIRIPQPVATKINNI